MPTDTLRDLFAAHEGKCSDKWDLYLRVYEAIFAPLRDKPIALLEVGVQNGGSLDIWSKYFGNATAIVGVDIDPRCALLTFDDERIAVVIGDVKQPETYARIAARSTCFDVIIDDGSHVSHDIIATFLRLVPLLGNNGIYLVEDMHASYWKEYGGELFAPYSAAAFFKALTDVINQEHWSLDKPAADLLKPFADHVAVALPMDDLKCVESVMFLNSLCIIRKTNGEPATLGQRRIGGNRSEIVRIEPLPSPVEAFARKARLSNAEDYFWAWQARPPMESLAAKTKAVIQLEHKITEQSAQLAELRRDSDLLQQRSNEQEQELISLREERNRLAVDLEKLRQEADQLRHHLRLIHLSTSWRLTGPLRFVARVGRITWHLLDTFFLNRSRCILNSLRDGYQFINYVLKVCLDEIKYRLSRFSGAANITVGLDIQKRQPMRSVAVIYLARGLTEEERRSIRTFLNSYKKYQAGLSHTLYVIYKGFKTESLRAQTQNSFDAPHVAINLNDENLDLGAYIEASRMVEDDYVFLLNTHSEIRDDNWLEKVIRPLADKKVGIVGCTGSFESLSALCPLFPPSPNPHLRSNGIALDRSMFVNMTLDDKITTKFDAWLIESGPNSLTRRIKSLNKRCIVVDVDGVVYEEDAWPWSGVFRHVFRQKALVIDNQIRDFESAKLLERLKMSFHTWRDAP
jgi:hypothetical protein